MAKEFKEKTITINLRKVFAKPVTKRAKAAVFAVKEAVKKETRAVNIKLSNLVNESLWEKGLYKVQRKITVNVVSEKDGVRVYLPNEKVQSKEVKEKKETPKVEAKEKKESATEIKTETKEEKPKTEQKPKVKVKEPKKE
jgi:large subunit ribosomal protein L31e